MNRDEKEQRDAQEEYIESDTDTLLKDQELARKPYPSDMLPEDYYQYKKFVNLPESQAEFEGLIDKDVVMANLSNSDREELNYRAVSVQWTKEIFTQEVDVFINSENPKEYYFNRHEIPEGDEDKFIIKRTVVFDQEAQPILNILKAGYKFRIVSSRATGDTRASMLDTMTQTRVQKELIKGSNKGKKFEL